jgi:dihydrodiol dehydrogenase / D-xylose 1-dehydrogenase (NADP)
MGDIIRWGIMGPGGIAHSFAKGVAALGDAKLVAVGSRSAERAKAFASEFGIGKAYGDYESLVRDPEVDAVYIATPHPAHRENALLCIAEGKAVLCEKPFTMNASEAADIASAARARKVFAMEAMWTRFLPATIKVREWLASGMIGDLSMMKADFGFRAEWKPEWRLLNRELGGGALLDAGIYPVSYASMVFGTQPTRIESAAQIGPTGVDERFAAVFGYDGGRLAQVSAAVRTRLVSDAWIYGTEGYIHVPGFLFGKSAELFVGDSPVEACTPEFVSTGYNYEAAAVGQLIRQGKTESPLMPLEETIAIMKTMDAIRKPWGLVYPSER